MPLFNIFKKKKKREKPKEKEEYNPLFTRELRDERENLAKGGTLSKDNTPNLSTLLVLKGPHISEKSSDLVNKNQYVFKIYPKINKIEIRKAIEELYGVKVVSIKTINIPAKEKRLGKNIGKQKGYKKAIVKIKEGQKIDVLPR